MEHADRGSDVMIFDRGAVSRPWFYVAMAGLCLGVALIGFAGTFFAPLAQGRFDAPAVIFVHGGLFFAWLILFVGQPSLIRVQAYSVHKIFGAAGAVMALAMAASGVGVGLFAAERDFAAGGGETAISSLLGVCTAMVMFVLLVGAGVAFRERPETHKRLMLLATLAVLWPAWFRFRHYFPMVPRPEFWFAVVAADSLIVACMIRDRLTLGRVHPVFLWVGSAIIADHLIEVLLFDNPAWRTAARALFDGLT
jgi:hypothetical protein